MKEQIGKLIRTRRSSQGLSAIEVAEQASVPLQTLEAFEEGQQPLTASALDRIANVLGVHALALREGRIEETSSVAVWFRQGAFADFRDDEDRPKIIAAFERAAALNEINAILRRSPSFRSRFTPEEPTPEAFQDGYRCARRVRAELGIEVEPLGDLVALVEEKFDILIRLETLASTRIDALSFRDPHTGAAGILLNASSRRRTNSTANRVDLVHELGHILFDPWNGKINLVVDQIDDEKGMVHGEQRARAFAAELLMPAEGLRKLLGSPQYEMGMEAALEMLERVRQHFDTPIEIAANHLKNREYIVHFLREPIIEAARKRTATTSMALETPRTTTHDVLTRRIQEALDKQLISNGHARELLGLTPWDDFPFPWVG